MQKVKDRVVLGILAGLAGNVAKMAVDELSLRVGISSRSFRSTAAGVWLGKRKQAEGVRGQVMGGLFDFGMSTLGGIGVVQLLTKTGRDYAAAKGILTGITLGSTITAILSITQSGIESQNPGSNLSYMASHAAYGAIAGLVAARLGDPQLFDAEPVNDYLPPTRKTGEQERQDRKQPAENREAAQSGPLPYSASMPK